MLQHRIYITFTYETNTLQGNDRETGIYRLAHIAMPSRDEIKNWSDVFAAGINDLISKTLSFFRFYSLQLTHSL